LIQYDLYVKRERLSMFDRGKSRRGSFVLVRCRIFRLSSNRSRFAAIRSSFASLLQFSRQRSRAATGSAVQLRSKELISTIARSLRAFSAAIIQDKRWCAMGHSADPRRNFRIALASRIETPRRLLVRSGGEGSRVFRRFLRSPGKRWPSSARPGLDVTPSAESADWNTR